MFLGSDAIAVAPFTPRVIYLDEGDLAVLSRTSADIFNAANASIVVAIMILQMIVSLSEDVLRSVPRSLREGAYALGATKLDVTAGVVVPAALSGIMASFLLAIARAILEKNDGGLRVASEVGRGSTFTVVLRAAPRGNPP